MARAALMLLALALPALALGQELPEPATVADGLGAVAAGASPDEMSSALRIIGLLTALSFLPAIVLAMTPFTRFVIVFALLRQALGLQQSPPNQVLIGLSLLLSLLVMRPTFEQVHADAVGPWLAGELGTVEAYEAGIAPMRAFMLRNVDREDLAVALRIGRVARPERVEDVPTSAIVTGFLLSELQRAFVIGVKVYVPFLVVDLVVASVLLGMGMMMLPPVVISLPFKLLLFVLIDGWSLLVWGLVAGFA